MFKTTKEKLDYLQIHGYNLKTGCTKRNWVLHFYTIVWAEKYHAIDRKWKKTKLEFDHRQDVDKYLFDLICECEWISTLKSKWYRLKRADAEYLK